MTLGTIIKNYRTKEKMSQADFAKKSGISKGYISMLEKNENPGTGKPIAPTYTIFLKVANATGCSLDDLIRVMDDSQMIRVNYAAQALDYSPSELMKGLEENRIHISNLKGIEFDMDDNSYQTPAPTKELSDDEEKLISAFRRIPEDRQRLVLSMLDAALKSD